MKLWPAGHWTWGFCFHHRGVCKPVSVVVKTPAIKAGDLGWIPGWLQFSSWPKVINILKFFHFSCLLILLVEDRTNFVRNSLNFTSYDFASIIQVLIICIICQITNINALHWISEHLSELYLILFYCIEIISQ